jgi:hypothetical protein
MDPNLFRIDWEQSSRSNIPFAISVLVAIGTIVTVPETAPNFDCSPELGNTMSGLSGSLYKMNRRPSRWKEARR